MKILSTSLLVLVLSASLFPQVVLEDFAASYASAVTTGTTTTITTDVDHGFVTRRAIASLAGVSTSLTDSKNFSIDGRTYVWKTTLGSPGAGETHVKLGTTGPESADNLYNAFNDTGVGEGTTYVQNAGVTGPHPNFTMLRRYGSTGSQVMYVQFNTAGVTGIGKSLSAQSPMQWTSGTVGDTTTDIWWNVCLEGGTGAQWGSTTILRCTKAVYVDTNQFSVPINTTGYTAYATYLSGGGTPLQIKRGNMELTRAFYNSVEGPGITDTIPPGTNTARFTIPRCTDSSDEINCGKGFISTYNQKQYLSRQTVTSMVVSGSTITFNLSGAFPDGAANGIDRLAVGSYVQVSGLQQYLTSTNPGYAGTPNAPAQSCAALMSYQGANKSRGFQVQSVNGGLTQLTIRNPADCPLADGTYSLTCLPSGACTTSYVNALGYVSITNRAMPYIYFKPKTTDSGYYFPAAYSSFYVKSGNWDPDFNRFTFWVKHGIPNARSANGDADLQWGTYSQTTQQDNTGSGTHYYTYSNFSAYPDAWMVFKFTNKVTHQVGGGINAGTWPLDPTRGHIFYPWFAGGPRGYMDSQTIWYLNWNERKGYLPDYPDQGRWDGQDVSIGPLVMSKDTSGEPEDFYAGSSAVCASDRFESPFTSIGSGNSGCEANWESAVQSGLVWRGRYSTGATSLKVAGWSSGTDAGTFNVPATLGGMWFISPNMSIPSNFRFAARPISPISGVSGSGGSSINVSTRYDLGLQAGDTVTVESVGGNTAANQTDAEITSVRARQLWWRFTPAVLGTAWTVPYTLTSVVASSSVCTTTLNGVDHNLDPGDVIEIYGSPNATLGRTSPATWTVIEDVSASVFRFSCPGVADGTYNTDYSTSYHFGMSSFPRVTYAGVGNGTYTSGGTIESTSNTRGFFEIDWAPYSPTGVIETSPDPVTGFTATAVSTSQIDLAWTDNATNETSYELQRCTTGVDCPSYSPLTTLAADSEAYSNSGLASSTNYSFRVRPCNSGGCAAWVTASDTTDSPVTGPTVPSSLVATSYNTRVTLSWTDNSEDESGFQVQVDSGSGYVDSCSTSANVTSCDVDSLIPSSNYTWKVKAVNANGSSSYSTPVSGNTIATLPLSIVTLKSSGIALSYVAPNGNSCSGTINGDAVSDEGGPRNRRLVLSLNSSSENPFLFVCGSSAYVGTFSGPEPTGGSSSVLITAARPVGSSEVDNLVVYAGPTSGSLLYVDSVACSGSDGDRCSISPVISNDQVLVGRRYWCKNRATDLQCANSNNIVARSSTFPLAVR